MEMECRSFVYSSVFLLLQDVNNGDRLLTSNIVLKQMGGGETVRPKIEVPCCAKAYEVIFYCKLFFLILVGLDSVMVPEAASIAMRLKWLILLMGSLLPGLVCISFRPTKYLALHRAAGAWVCNSLVLVIAHFLNKMYLKREIYSSETLRNFVSDHPDFILAFPGFSCILGGTILIVPIIFRSCVFLGSLVSLFRRTQSPGLVILIILGLVLCSVFVLPSLTVGPIHIHIPTIPSSHMISAFFTTIRTLQPIISSLLISINLAFPISSNSKLSMRRRVLSALLVVVCIVQGAACLWSDVQVHKGEFICSGLFTFVWVIIIIRLVFLEDSLLARDSDATTEENHEMILLDIIMTV